LPLFDLQNLTRRVPLNFKASYVGNNTYLLCGGHLGDRVSRQAFTFESGHLEQALEMYTAREYHAVVTHHNLTYAIGGFDGTKALQACEAYDSKTGEWHKYAQMITGRISPGACLIDDVLYVFGGKTVDSKYLSTVERLNLELNMWGIAMISLPMPLSNMYVHPVRSDYIVILGGVSAEGVSNKVHLYHQEK
jgi:hypothetical protein